MARADIALVRELIDLQAPSRTLPLILRRRNYEQAEAAFAKGHCAQLQSIDAGGCEASWIVPKRTAKQPVLVYLHGGGYCLGSSRSHRHLAAAIGNAADTAVLSLDYRRAPEHPFPAAVDDAFAALRWLLGQTGAQVVLAGDSAGGGLAIATMLRLREDGLALPCACVCLSPWVDLTCDADSHTALAERDPLLSSAELRRMASAYLKGEDPRHPLASPLYSRLAGLPPLLIQVGTEEILRDDAHSLARAARREGVEVTLQAWPEMLHAWQWYFPVLDEGRRAIAQIGQFLADRLTCEPVAVNGCSRPAMARRGTTQTAKRVAVSPIQEGHLAVARASAGRGYLSWVYQLNGPLDRGALTRAIEEVVRDHEILRVRFERAWDGLYQVVMPYAGGALRLLDLSRMQKRIALDEAFAQAEALHGSRIPLEDPSFRATLYTIDHKTSVLAMSVAEALVDSDSGTLLSAAITRAYAEQSGTTPPDNLPDINSASYLDHLLCHPPDTRSVGEARAYWSYQARRWATLSEDPPTLELSVGSTFSFALAQNEWERVTSSARALGATPYVLMLTCLQLALASTVGPRRFLVHSVVSRRDRAARGMIGNFHGLVTIDMRPDSLATLPAALTGTTIAVAEAIEHSALPAPLTRGLGRSDSTLAGIRFYMFAHHDGPRFAGVRRRRIRLHGASKARLSFNCIYGPGGRQDFVLSSTVAPSDELQRLAANIREAIDLALTIKPMSRELAVLDRGGASLPETAKAVL